jgi:hypothetical protein
MLTMMVHQNLNWYFYQYYPWVMDDDDILNWLNAMENEQQPKRFFRWNEI